MWSAVVNSLYLWGSLQFLMGTEVPKLGLLLPIPYSSLLQKSELLSIVYALILSWFSAGENCCASVSMNLPHQFSYMKMHSTAVVNPSNHDVRARHLTTGGEPQAHPTCCMHTHSEINCSCFRVEVPVELIKPSAHIAIECSIESVGG